MKKRRCRRSICPMISSVTPYSHRYLIQDRSGYCRRTEFLPCDPGTLLFWRGGEQGFLCSRYCARKQ
uniref:Uncharacterized protein n=1 Tax=Anguilla anguilla TaxID=7936 RepID=A0A0E9QIY6_ANGAN